MGDDGAGSIQWKVSPSLSSVRESRDADKRQCDADLPDGMRFGRVEVSCEGWTRAGDPNILQGMSARLAAWSGSLAVAVIDSMDRIMRTLIRPSDDRPGSRAWRVRLSLRPSTPLSIRRPPVHSRAGRGGADDTVCAVSAFEQVGSLSSTRPRWCWR